MREAGAVLERCGSLASSDDNDLERRAEELRGAARCRREDAATARESFALVTECIRRETGLTLHTAQIAAGLAMMRGSVAELATGEGKTLAAILPAVLAGWRGRGCHIVTANDYPGASGCGGECADLCPAWADGGVRDGGDVGAGAGYGVPGGCDLRDGAGAVGGLPAGLS